MELLRPLLPAPCARAIDFTIDDPEFDREDTVGRAGTAALVEALRP